MNEFIKELEILKSEIKNINEVLKIYLNEKINQNPNNSTSKQKENK